MGMTPEEQDLLHDSITRILGDRYGFEQRAAIIRSEAGWSSALWQQFADLGLLGIPFSAELGGSNDPAAIRIVMEAFGRALVIEPFLPTVVLAGALLRSGSASQRHIHIPAICAGDAIWSVAFAEPDSRYDPAWVGTTARLDGQDHVIDGEKIAVLAGPVADFLIVSARIFGDIADRDGIGLFIVPNNAAGVTSTNYPTIDSGLASNIRFDGVRVGPEALIGGAGNGLQRLEAALDEANVALCASAVGAIEALNEKTLAFCRERIVFGEPLASFQVVKHRLVDMRVAQEHARAMTLKAYQALAREGAIGAAVASATKVQVAKEADLVGREAVQLHGAMGITDELDISHYFRWITLFEGMFGDGDHHVRRFIARHTDAPRTAMEALEAATELEALTADEIAFRDEVRRFYDENLTDELRRAADMTLWHMTPFPAGAQWQRILHAHGYGAPGWPVEHGGRGWTATQHLIWNAETARARPPLVMSMGKVYAGPCIMKFGSEEQKALFLPRILSGEDWWAQGYSEPGAGSDLAALQLSAVSDGDDYILNGSKIWTTFAHNANRIFCLVRTSTRERKQQGITFLLIDMDTPGIEIRPIINIAGDHDFNQVFFTDVRVPKSRRLGEEHEGWTVARHLLLYEHGANLARTAMENIRRLGWLREIASLEADGAGGRLIDDPDFARQIAEVDIGVQALDFACRQQFARTQAGAPPGSGHELLSIRAKELAQHLTKLAMRAIGYRGIVSQPEARAIGTKLAPIGPEHALLPMPFYLTQRGLTIAGGTPEVHRNNLAKHLLGLR
jgi:alkylation response protein AidB-like acyl-CoA dehydrogenase